VRAFLEAIAVNAVAVVLLYLVVVDMGWRASCATLSPAGCRASVASITYWPFFDYYHLIRAGTVLTSPPTFDWIQALVVFLVVFDLYFAYRWFRARNRSRSGSEPAPPATSHAPP
jgi:hypothetical protein